MCFGRVQEIESIWCGQSGGEGIFNDLGPLRSPSEFWYRRRMWIAISPVPIDARWHARIPLTIPNMDGLDRTNRADAPLQQEGNDLIAYLHFAEIFLLKSPIVIRRRAL